MAWFPCSLRQSTPVIPAPAFAGVELRRESSRDELSATGCSAGIRSGQTHKSGRHGLAAWMLAALCALPATGQETKIPFDELLYFGAGFAFALPYSQGYLEGAGIGVGYSWIGAYSSVRLPLYFRATTDGPRAYLPFTFLYSVTSIAGVLILTETGRIEKDGWKDKLADALAISNYVFAPELRLFPGLPVHPVAGYKLDLLYSPAASNVRTVYGFRAGLNMRLPYLRVQAGYDANWIGTIPSHGPYAGIGLRAN